MDKGVLIEYADMKEEIKDLRRRIEKIQKELDKLHGQIVVDSVSCGKKGQEATWHGEDHWQTGWCDFQKRTAAEKAEQKA